MIIADMHTHTHMSGDCLTDAKEMIQTAEAKGFRYYAVTDHHDIDFPAEGFEMDIPTYQEALKTFVTYPTGDMQVLKGIEFGLEPKLAQNLVDFAQLDGFDFIVGSCHLAGGMDPYDKAYFDGRSRDEGYGFFFESILDNVRCHNDFDTLAHLDYVIRYWRGDGPKTYAYKDFAQILDEVLKVLIRKDKSLEVNTSGYLHRLNGPNPSYDVLTRYYELGGRQITIGSDAHMPKNIGTHFDIVEERLRAIGFDHYMVYVQRKPVAIGF